MELPAQKLHVNAYARKHLQLWMKASRVKFTLASVLPFILGSVIAWSIANEFSWTMLILGAFGVFSGNLGANLCNDYFDYKSGADIINKDFNKFTGGSHVLPAGLLEPQKVLLAALLSWSVLMIIAVYLALTRSWILLILALVGILSGALYTTTPVQTSYHGLGELLIAFAAGWLCVISGYFIQTSTFAIEAQIASIPPSLTAFLLIWINEFPDYQADKQAGKNTLVVKMGLENSAKVYSTILITAFTWIPVGVILGYLPIYTLITLILIPMVMKAIQGAKMYKNHEILEKTCGATIGIHILISLLLILGFLINGLV